MVKIVVKLIPMRWKVKSHSTCFLIAIPQLDWKVFINVDL